MGSRITRAATHLSENAVQERMRREQRPWCRQRWEIIYQALKAPRKAEDIARTVGVSLTTVHRVISAYNQAGVAAIETPGKGGRHHHYLTLEQERTFLQPFLERVARGEMATVVEIQFALEARIGHEVHKSTLYRLLDRHGWQQIGAEASPAQAKAGKSVEGDMVPVRQESRSAQGDTGAGWERRQQQAPLNAQRKLSPQRYPSDLSDQEWAILEPLIPRGFARGTSSKRRYAYSDRSHLLRGPHGVGVRVPCRMTFRRGRRSGPTSERFATMALGSASIRPCARRCECSRAVSRRPAQRSSTANPSRRAKKGAARL